MDKIETRIKRKENSIRKAWAQVRSIQQQLSGLEEARIFCDEYKKDVTTRHVGRYRIDTGRYRYWDTWMSIILEDTRGGGFRYMSLFSGLIYSVDTDEIEMNMHSDHLEFFEKCYPQMLERLISDLEAARSKLSMRYEEYGRLVYEAKLC